MLGWIFDFYSLRGVRGRRRAKAKRERGFVLVLCAVFLVVLTAAGGFAVDLGAWYWNASRLQRAADAAALAGAPFLPGDVAGAEKAAIANLKSNGYDNVQIQRDRLSSRDDSDPRPYAYITPDKPGSNKLRVQVSKSFPTFFTSLLGYNNQYLMRQSIGEFTAAIQMGSPGNILGANVSQGSFPSQFFGGRYWLNASGGQQMKAQGDRYMSENCASDNGAGADNCNGGVNSDRPYGNGPRSHRFIVTVPPGVHGNMMIQAFDPVHSNMGNRCESAQLGTVTPATVFTNPAANPADGEPAEMYTAGVESPYCTNDEVDSGKPQATLTLGVYKSGSKNNLGAPLAPKKTWGSIAEGDNLQQRLTADPLLRDGFRHWSNLYPQPIAVGPGKYVIEATTPPQAGGTNRFALRVGMMNFNKWDVALSKKVSIEADKHLTIYTNAPADQSQFYFAKLTTNLANRTLDVNLYDIGDTAGGGAVSLNLVAPTGSTGLPSGPDGKPSFGPCEQIGPGGAPAKVNNPCGIVNATSDVYNGKIVKLRIRVPAGYTCDDDGTSKCWMSLKFILNSTSATAPSNDTTTWEMKECGAPSRLLPDDYEKIGTCNSKTS